MIKKIYHSADWQYCVSRTENFDNAASQYFKLIVEDIKKYGLDNKEVLQVIAGDIFHNKMKSSVQDFLAIKDFLRKCGEISEVIVTVGNHDYDMKNKQRGDMLSLVFNNFLIPNVNYYLNSEIIEYENLRFFIISNYDDNKFPDNYSTDIEKKDKFNIGIYHDTLVEASNYGDAGSSKFFKNSLSLKKFNGLDALIMGDIHKRQILLLSNGAKAVYSGSPYQHHYGESINNHGLVVWDIDNEITPHFIDIEPRQRFIKANFINNKLKVLNEEI